MIALRIQMSYSRYGSDIHLMFFLHEHYQTHWVAQTCISMHQKR